MDSWRKSFGGTSRRKTRQIRLGNVLIGGGAPIPVQFMTKTETTDVEAMLWQIRVMIMVTD